MWPIIERLKARGRPLSNDEMLDDVATHMKLSAEARAVPQGNGATTLVNNRMAWARTYLKKVGALENSARGVWRLTPSGAEMTRAQVEAVPRRVRQDYQGQHPERPSPSDGEVIALPDLEADWREQLLRRLYAISPAAFERLCQRLLREAGFTRVEVTGKTSDGGIDGTGVLRSHGGGDQR